VSSKTSKLISFTPILLTFYSKLTKCLLLTAFYLSYLLLSYHTDHTSRIFIFLTFKTFFIKFFLLALFSSIILALQLKHLISDFYSLLSVLFTFSDFSPSPFFLPDHLSLGSHCYVLWTPRFFSFEEILLSS